MGLMRRIFLHRRSNLGSIFVNAGISTVSISPRLDRCFVLRLVNDEKAFSYKYVDAKGRRVSIASRDKFGYSNLMPTQNEFRLILANIVFREE